MVPAGKKQYECNRSEKMTNGFTTINLLLDADCVIGKGSVPLRLEDDTILFMYLLAKQKNQR